LPCEVTPEFRCIGLGGLYLSGLDRAIVASLGTGTALVHAERDAAPTYLGGTGVGGGTLMGLAKKMLGMENLEHIEELAREGDLSRVDLKIIDLTKQDIVPGFSDKMTASNFANVSDIATKDDIASGLMNMVLRQLLYNIPLHSMRTAVRFRHQPTQCRMALLLGHFQLLHVVAILLMDGILHQVAVRR
jgi:type II pantothenate kinase